jgi:HlyD family secretion protein
MSSSQATPLAALRQLAGPPDPGPDEELLRKFCTDRDESAFAVLVRRHGGLVLDVCRTVLRNDADAEDSFQATFVVLAANANRVRRPAALAGWLHAVACRTAGKARRARDRRRVHEARALARLDAPAPDPSWTEVRQAIHEEVNRLPDRYRAAVVLFYLSGQTQDEVGRALGLSTAGAKKRLERGRSLLRSALDRRGFGPTVALAAAAITLPSPAVALSAAAAELAVRFVTNRAAVPAAILSLVPNGVRPMSAKIAFGAAVLLGAATTVGFGVLRGGPGDEPGRAGDPPVAAQAKTPDRGGQPERPAPRPLVGDRTPKEPLATQVQYFRDLEPKERLKLVEKLAGGGSSFTAAKRGDLAVAVIERGSLESANNFDVICKVKGKDKESPATTIKWVIDEGSLVKKGDRIAQLDDSALQEQHKAATVKAKEAEAAVTAATENVLLMRQESNIESQLAEIDVMLVEAELKDTPPGKARDILVLKVEQAKLKSARAKARAKAQITRSEADLRAKTAAWELESQRQRNIEAELKHCELTAPSDGFVVYPTSPSGRFGGPAAVIAAGESVREGQKLLRVTDLKEMVIAVRVHEALISTVRVGAPAQVRIDAIPGKPLRGKVTQVSSVASAADWKTADVKVYPVIVAIEDAPPGLKPGMSGEANIATGEKGDVLQVPLKAVVMPGKDRICYVKSGQELIERRVVTGASNADSIEIRDGLKEGDVVVSDLLGLLAR